MLTYAEEKRYGERRPVSRYKSTCFASTNVQTLTPAAADAEARERKKAEAYADVC
jgi:hypothetical protein